MSWEKAKIKDVCEGIYDGPHATPPVSNDGAIFLGISNITQDGHLDISNPKYISEDDFPRWTKRVIPQGGDIVFSYEATLNLYAVIPDGFHGCLGRRMTLIRPDETKVNGRFLYYYFFSEKWRRIISENTVIGATVDRIPLIRFPDFLISFPSLEEQKAIAGILSAYDNLIENNQKQIKLLEEAAQRLYKEWFVDLRFPGHENTKIVDGVPEGWQQLLLDQVAPILTGKKDANFSTINGQYPFFTCAQIPLQAPAYSFDCNAVILAGNGDFNVKLYRGQFEAYQRTYVLSPKNKEMLFLLFHAVNTSIAKLAQGASGSTIKFLTKGMIASIPVYVPDTLILKKFNEMSEAIQEQVENLRSMIAHATEARDRLLPKLMGGEIEV